jgi:hypothetical protein
MRRRDILILLGAVLIAVPNGYPRAALVESSPTAAALFANYPAFI